MLVAAATSPPDPDTLDVDGPGVSSCEAVLGLFGDGEVRSSPVCGRFDAGDCTSLVVGPGSVDGSADSSGSPVFFDRCSWAGVEEDGSDPSSELGRRGLSAITSPVHFYLRRNRHTAKL